MEEEVYIEWQIYVYILFGDSLYITMNQIKSV
jgi:hypothetical protein